MMIINNLPKEFNFISNVNPLNLLYHAKEEKNGYKITCDESGCEWNYTKKEFHERLLKNDFEVVNY